MARKNSVPNYSELITVTYAALKALGGSGKNDEINNKAAEILGLSDDVLEVPHLNSSSLSEINYRLAWARTLLKRSGAIANSARAVWAISPSFSDVAEVDGAAINKAYHMILDRDTHKLLGIVNLKLVPINVNYIRLKIAISFRC